MAWFCHILDYSHSKLFRYFFLGVGSLAFCFLLTRVRDLLLNNMNKACHIFGFSSKSKPIHCVLADRWTATHLKNPFPFSPQEGSVANGIPSCSTVPALGRFY